MKRTNKYFENFEHFKTLVKNPDRYQCPIEYKYY